MTDTQAVSRADAIVVVARMLRKPINVVYGLTEAGVGGFMMTAGLATGVGILGLAPLYDGIRRLHSEIPASAKKFASVFLTGKEPVAKPAKPKNAFSRFVDVAAAGTTMVVGGYMLMAGTMLAAWLGTTGMLSFMVYGGALLAAGGAVSTAKRTVSFFKNHVSFGIKNKASQSETAAPTTAVTPSASAPAVSNANAQAAFNAAGSEKKEDVKPASPVPDVKPPSKDLNL